MQRPDNTVMDPKIIAEQLTANRNTQRMLKYLVIAHMRDIGLTKEQAEQALQKLLS